MAKNKNKKWVIIVIVLASLSFWLIINNRNATIKEELRNFTIKDTASITRIFLADKSGEKSDLTRTPKGWLVNGEFNARKEAINLILKTITSLQVKNPVPKTMLKNIIKNMASNAVKVEFYNGSELIKTLYVGPGNQQGDGTFMMVEGAETPFVVELPGFQGILKPRFFCETNLWRDRKVYPFLPTDIASLQIQYFQRKESSFKLTLNEQNNLCMSSLFPKEELIAFDTITAKEYLTTFVSVNFEQFVNELKQNTIDSIVKMQPFHQINIVLKNGKKSEIKTFPVKAKEGTTDKDGKPRTFDYDRMYALIDGKEFVYVQFYAFDVILKPIEYFKIGKDALLKTM